MNKAEDTSRHHLPCRSRVAETGRITTEQSCGEVKLGHLPAVTQIEAWDSQRAFLGFRLIPPDPAWHKVDAQ